MWKEKNQMTMWKEKTRCLKALVLAVWKEKLDTGKPGIGSSERKIQMSESFVLAVRKEKLDTGKPGIGSSVRKKPDARKLGIGSPEGKS
jgi:hypothetical protein